MDKKYEVIIVPSGWGAQLRSCGEGPKLLKNDIQEILHSLHTAVEWKNITPLTPSENKDFSSLELLEIVNDLNYRLADCVEIALEEHLFPIVIGGDHSIGVGTWTGALMRLRHKEKRPFGLIWIDAHMDAHTPETSYSQALHGMPVAALMGSGPLELSALSDHKFHIEPNKLCLIGTRSFEAGEAELLRRSNVKIYFIDEVLQRGFKNVLREAISYVNRGTYGYGVSLDLDVIDPLFAPGVGSPEVNGIGEMDLFSALPLLAKDPRLKAFELVEFNPALDFENKTFQLCHNLMSGFF